MPERLAVPMRENGQSRQPKNLEMLAFFRRPALTFLEEEEGDQGNSIIITVTGEPRVNPRSIVTIFCKIYKSFPILIGNSQGEDNNACPPSATNNTTTTTTSSKSSATIDKAESEAEVENGNGLVEGGDDHAAAEGERGGGEASQGVEEEGGGGEEEGGGQEEGGAGEEEGGGESCSQTEGGSRESSESSRGGSS